MEPQNLTLEIEQSVEIKAPIQSVYDGLISRLSSNNVRPDGEPMTMCLEQRPGGRWFRDLGDDSGHLWGFVQVIKPPHLLEISGPMFMSYPVAGHIQFRLTESDNGTTLTLRHRAFGLIEDEHREHAVPGWQSLLTRVQSDLQSQT